MSRRQTSGPRCSGATGSRVALIVVGLAVMLCAGSCAGTAPTGQGTTAPTVAPTVATADPAAGLSVSAYCELVSKQQAKSNVASEQALDELIVAAPPIIKPDLETLKSAYHGGATQAEISAANSRVRAFVQSNCGH